MGKQYVLFEHAAGYGLFKVEEFEEIGAFLAQVESSVTDLSRFNSVVKLVGFSPFKTAANALENINAVSEGIVTDDLQLFLETQIPKAKKSSKIVLGVSDPKLAATISETLGITCSHTGIFPELIRGIRYHFHNLVKGFTFKSSATAQLGLGHSYSRAKVKFNVHRNDNMIIQSIALLDQLDKNINTFAMRIREWYSYHFPELVKIVPDNYTYAMLTKFIKNRKELTEESLERLEEITMDSAKAQAILDASKSSMGMDISPIDLINIEMFASRVIDLADYRKKLHEYLTHKMAGVAPNLCTLIGEQVGARLIAHAGSLTNLAKYPASTVQILGAEKALFRALKMRSNTPKYGLLYHSSFIGRANMKNKGRISRYLANKCSIASRIDCFADVPTTVFGEKLRQQVEDRLKFYENGEIPKKNIDVMKEAILEATQVIKSMKKKSKKKKKQEAADESNHVAETEETPAKKKKDKKKQKEEEEKMNLDGTVEENGETPAKKKKDKKKRKITEETQEEENTNLDGTVEENGESPGKKKKDKKKRKVTDETQEEEKMDLDGTVEENGESPKKKKKKKKKEE